MVYFRVIDEIASPFSLKLHENRIKSFIKMNLICKYHGNRSNFSMPFFYMEKKTRSNVELIDINIRRVENLSHNEQRTANSKQ